jgi:signal transduction histidine kinase
MASPIQTIGLAVDLVLSGEAGAGGEPVEVLSRASDAAQNLSEMVSSLLDVSRMESGQMPLHPTRVDLQLLAREAAEAMHLLAGVKGVRLSVQGPSVPLCADPDLIRRVFINLIRNALKFTPEGSEVTVAVSAADGRATAEVHDTGIGIPEEYHERIFEKFGQVGAGPRTHERSFGLGLTFCRLAVLAHGGRIGVRSTLGAGSTFWFALPVAGTGALNPEPSQRTSSAYQVCLPVSA